MNDVTMKVCGFGADMVPYMYAELPDAKRTAFESHLLECTACTDEFASLSLARYEVYDWKKLEFDGLATPKFSIPFEVDSESVQVSWVDKVRSAFSGRWAAPGAAFAGLAMVSLFAAVFVLPLDNGSDVAAISDRSNAVMEYRPANTIDEQAIPPVQNEEKNEAAAVAVSRSAPRETSSATPKRSARKVAVRGGVNASPRSYKFTQASARNVQKKAPRLNEFVENEDTSLRLAELFDDLDSRN